MMEIPTYDPIIITSYDIGNKSEDGMLFNPRKSTPS